MIKRDRCLDMFDRYVIVHIALNMTNVLVSQLHIFADMDLEFRLIQTAPRKAIPHSIITQFTAVRPQHQTDQRPHLQP